jgi:hypothetical protein
MWVQGQNALQTLYKIALLQLAGTDVDADRHIETCGLPCRDLMQSGFNDPLAHCHGQWVVFDHWQKGSWCQ